MIRYHDFIPQRTAQPGFLKPAEYEPLDVALADANEWIKENDVRVLNVETVVLPNIWSRFEEGTHDPALATSGESPSYWYQVIRVWYEAG